MLDFTTCLTVDQQHAAELCISYPTWVKYHPEIITKPMVVVYDPPGSNTYLPPLIRMLPPKTRFVPLTERYAPDQRSHMLTALVKKIPYEVETPWLLKLDTDCLADATGIAWCEDWLIEDDPVFIASPWSYTKPADAINRLDAWADMQPVLCEMPPLRIRPAHKNDTKVRHKRIISWLFFGDAEWCREVAEFAGDEPLPVASHDTYLWYCAARLCDYYKTVRFTSLGWRHASRHLAERAAEVMEDAA